MSHAKFDKSWPFFCYIERLPDGTKAPTNTIQARDLCHALQKLAHTLSDTPYGIEVWTKSAPRLHKASSPQSHDLTP
jgi:hypothetical protein